MAGAKLRSSQTSPGCKRITLQVYALRASQGSYSYPALVRGTRTCLESLGRRKACLAKLR